MKLIVTVKGKDVAGENPFIDQAKLDLQIEDNTVLDLIKLTLRELGVLGVLGDVGDLHLTPEELDEVDKQDKKDEQKKKDEQDKKDEQKKKDLLGRNHNEVETVPHVYW